MMEDGARLGPERTMPQVQVAKFGTFRRISCAKILLKPWLGLDQVTQISIVKEGLTGPKYGSFVIWYNQVYARPSGVFY